MTSTLDYLVPKPALRDGSPQLVIDVARHETPEHPDARALVAVCEAAIAAGTPLARKDVPSRPLLRFMPQVFLLEPLEGGADWRFRLFGAGIAQRLGGDPTGAKISELYSPDQVRHQAEEYRITAELRRPAVTGGKLYGIERDFLKLEFCNLSLEPPAGDVRWILGGVFVFAPRH